MCDHSLEYARAQGFLAMQFNFVVSSNQAAIHLWEKFGFATVGRLPKASCTPALVMWTLLLCTVCSERPRL